MPSIKPIYPVVTSLLLLGALVAPAHAQVHPYSFPGGPGYPGGMFPGGRGGYPGGYYPTAQVSTSKPKKVEKDENLVLELDMDGDVYDVAFSDSGNSMAAVDSKGNLTLWNKNQSFTNPAYLLSTTVNHKGLNRTLDFDPEEEKIVAGGAKGSVFLFNAKTLELIKEIGFEFAEIMNVRFSPLGNRILVTSKKNHLKLLDATTLEQVHEYKIEALGEGKLVYSISGEFSPDGSQIAVSVTEPDHHRIVILEAESGEILRDFSSKRGWVAKFNPQMTKLIAGSLDKNGSSLKIWDLETDELIYEKATGDYVLDVGFSPEGTHILFTDKNDDVTIMEIVQSDMVELDQFELKQVVTFKDHNRKEIRAAEFSPDAKFVVTGGKSKKLKIYRTGLKEQTSWTPLEGERDIGLLNFLKRFQLKAGNITNEWALINKTYQNPSEISCLREELNLRDATIRVNEACGRLQCMFGAKLFLNAPWNREFMNYTIDDQYKKIQNLEERIKNRPSVKAAACSN